MFSVSFISLHPNCDVGKLTRGKRLTPPVLIVTVLLSLVLVHDDNSHLFTHLIYY